MIRRLILSALASALLLPCGASAEPYSPDNVAREYLWEEFVDMPPAFRPKVGLALSAGGARGFTHVGVVEALTNAGFPVDAIAGTSMGAVVGAFFSAGLPTSRLWEISQNASLSYATKDFNVFGVLGLIVREKLLSSQEMEHFIERNIGNITFQELKIPFACIAMDIKTGEKVVFNEGPLGIAVRSSMNLPGIFAPVEYRHRYLVDGGVVDSLPVSTVRALGADWVLASLAFFDYTNTSLESILAYLLQVTDIRGAMLAESSIKDADFSVQPNIGDIGVAEFHRTRYAGEMGVEEMYAKLDKAKESLLLFTIDYANDKNDK